MHRTRAWVPSRFVLVGTALGLLTATPYAEAAEDRPKKSPPLGPILQALGVDIEDTVPLTHEQRHIAEAAGHRMVSLCPDCRLSTIEEDGPCGWSRMNRLIIRAAAAKGHDEEAIVQTYVQTYGPRILARSKSRGFAAASWGVPIGGALAGLFIVFFIGGRMRRPQEPEPAPSPKNAPSASEHDRQLEQELAALDS